MPLTGIDPDGDSVRLLGQDTGPEKGQVTEVGPDWIDYRAGDYSTGTDAFAYAVVDGLGARATGTIRVGISPRVEGARNPVATADVVTVRPGRVLRVQVLANDTDPDGGALSLVSVQPQSARPRRGTRRRHRARRRARGGRAIRLRLRRAERARRHGRGVPHGHRGSGRAAHAPDRARHRAPALRRARPHERRRRRDAQRLLGGGRRVGARALRRRGLPGRGARDARRPDPRGGRRRAPHRAVHGGAAGRRGRQRDGLHLGAGLRGHAAAAPRGRARPTVASGERLVVDLDDHVVAAGGRAVRIADPNSLSATHADGPVETVDDDTVAYRSEPGYFGPAAISFTVTDSAGDGGGRTAALVLPITITPTENQPPVFTGAVIDLEPGQSKDIDLGRLTTYPTRTTAGSSRTRSRAPWGTASARRWTAARCASPPTRAWRRASPRPSP
ncbi:Ig-like domain-containing protein [Clavibacter tessellarius]|uniref:Ig-like domain-containing protein n=1 Tax=Clavibacter tessellarius TaxID=31965 RepID=UPI0032484D55